MSIRSDFQTILPNLRSFCIATIGISLGSLALIGPSSALAAPLVVVSIKPIHSLVSAVMGETGTPDLLIEGAGSPHGYQLKPSQAARLQDANVIFWIGPELESFLEKTIETVATKAKSVALIDAPEVHRLPPRSGGAIEEHVHHGETGHEVEHDHEATHENEHESEHDEGHDHHAETVDPHVWLDPENAKAFVTTIAETLSAEDSENAEVYRANAASEIERLKGMSAEINAKLSPVRGRPFVVFHDAYQYFEHRFDIEAAGSITVNPELKPGAERVSEIRTKLKSLQAACVFSEPQFEPKIIKVVTEGTSARAGVLDPIGANLAAGPDQYQNLLMGMADAFVDCLTSE